MKHLLSISMAMCLTLAVLGGCRIESKNRVNSRDGLKPSKQGISYTYKNVKDFSVIDANIAADIEYRQSDTTSVIVEGPDNYVPLILVKEENGVLKITAKENAKFSKGHLIKIKLSSPNLIRIENKGTGNIKLADTLRVANLEIESHTADYINVEYVICDTFAINNKGVGDTYYYTISTVTFENGNQDGIGDEDERDEDGNIESLDRIQKLMDSVQKVVDDIDF